SDAHTKFHFGPRYPLREVPLNDVEIC
ncbi:unnamed protein product, partial [Allacma fusca]